MATYAIGDIQGCYEPLQRLLQEIHYQPGQDTLWLAGDLVNRGPDSLAVLRWAMDQGDRVVAVLGNHDLHLIARFYGNPKKSKSDTLDAILTAPDARSLIDWLRHRPLVHCQDGWCLSHAGIPPQWTCEQARRLAAEVEQQIRQPDPGEFFMTMYGNDANLWDEALHGPKRWRTIVNYLTRMRFVDPEGTLDFKAKEGLESCPPGFMPWFEAPGRLAVHSRLIFGHWAALMGVTKQDNVYAVDTGCVWGGQLTALRLEDQRRFAVNAAATGTN